MGYKRHRSNFQRTFHVTIRRAIRIVLSLVIWNVSMRIWLEQYFELLKVSIVCGAHMCMHTMFFSIRTVHVCSKADRTNCYWFESLFAFLCCKNTVLAELSTPASVAGEACTD